jgi:hypothetical protein
MLGAVLILAMLALAVCFVAFITPLVIAGLVFYALGYFIGFGTFGVWLCFAAAAWVFIAILANCSRGGVSVGIMLD